ncbi:hypothetical protein [Bradyrhizobium sp. 1(2017)]|uniref:hypothetical protein n=1 Tax=Bradyrhizobium sp. 1(2017) TaxID=1404888 RepID=UPI00140EEC45|nr:hypothetical protein [Bradyrhizobium sp. 1(2017)]QIO31446.1 hypothetical protein HAP40_06210 [Bradyrhizobium sp. 1(2017)]
MVRWQRLPISKPGPTVPSSTSSSDMRQDSAHFWMIKCTCVAAALLLACGLATARFGSALQQPAVTTRDGSLITLNRYVREPTPEMVLVGSSVAWRLKEEYFSLPGVRNLALAGGSPVTGLEIVARQARLPKVVLIETNVLSRAPDSALIETFSSGAGAQTQLLRPVRTAIAAYESWSHAAPSREHARAEQDRLLSRSPATFDNKVYLDRAVDQMNGDDPTVPTRANVALLRTLIDDMQRRGTRAFLIHVPFAPEVEDSRFVRTTKEIVHEAFPDPALWLTVNPPTRELRWDDGIHLDERSALMVVRAIEGALAGRPAATPPR